MAFGDWFKSSSPEGSGGQSGSSLGSLFGPQGLAIGAVVGAGLAPLLSGSSSSRNRMTRRATDASYGFAKETFRYSKESRSGIRDQFDQDLSALTAQYASSGAQAGSMFETQRGELLRERNKALKELGKEIQGYRQGPNYEFFRKDYEHVTDITRSRIGRDDEYLFELGGSSTRSSRELESPYSNAMRKRMDITSMRGTGRSAQFQLFEEYAKRVRPSMGQYERFVFGSKEDRKAYTEYMNNRIDSANKWFRAETAILAQEQARRFSGRGQDR